MSAAYDKVLVMTDLHLKAGGGQIIGLDPVARARAVLGAALAAHGDARALILTGDLTHSGRAEEYAVLAQFLDGCPIPVTFMLGNHDHRGRFRAAFPKAPVTEGGHVQRIIDLPHHRLITLDTYDALPDPHHSGWLCADRLAWLDAALGGVLDGAEGRMPVVFAHHPPHAIGLPGMDAIALRNGAALLTQLRAAGAHLVCGHIHRTISGVVDGVPFSIFKSPCHQAPLDLDEVDSTLSIDEPGAYGLLLLRPGAVIAHSEDVGLPGVVVSGSDALPDL